MPAVQLTPEDIAPFAPDASVAKVQAMIDDALAWAVRVAPCILDDDFQHPDAAKAILRNAILRWIQISDEGTTLVAGQFELRKGVTSGDAVRLAQMRSRRSLFWPSEINDLQELCQDSAPDAVSMTSPGL